MGNVAPRVVLVVSKHGALHTGAKGVTMTTAYAPRAADKGFGADCYLGRRGGQGSPSVQHTGD